MEINKCKTLKIVSMDAAFFFLNKMMLMVQIQHREPIIALVAPPSDSHQESRGCSGTLGLSHAQDSETLPGSCCVRLDYQEPVNALSGLLLVSMLGQPFSCQEGRSE